MGRKDSTRIEAPKSGSDAGPARKNGSIAVSIGFHGIVFGLLIAGLFGASAFVSEEVSSDLSEVAALLPDFYQVKAMLSDLI